MNTLIPMELVHNAALLIALGFLYDTIIANQRPQKVIFQQVFSGIVIGAIGVFIMRTPWALTTGIIFDTRSVLLGISGLFFGAPPTLIAMLITGILRLSMGGDGALMGIMVITTSGLIGIFWRHCHQGKLVDISVPELFLFGLVIHIVMLACTFFLPPAKVWTVFSEIAPSVMLIHPIGTMLLGMIMVNRLKVRRTEEENLETLKQSEVKYRSLFENSVMGFFQTTPEGKMIKANQAFAKMYGYDSPEDILAAVTNVSTQLYADPMERNNTRQILKEYGFMGPREIRGLRRDGNNFWASVTAREVRDSNNNLLYYEGTSIDISERKRVEEQINNSLREKEVLLRELYHRTKNNMQTIRSMLILQSANTENEEVKSLVQSIDNKIQTMALVHQMLYQSPNLSSIDLSVYIEDLVYLAHSSYHSGHNQIILQLALTPFFSSIDVAIPIGLMVNELLSNIYKHAFPNNRQGEIWIVLEHSQDAVRLQISDNGVSLPPEFDLRHQKTYGLQSVYSIAEHQLGANVKVTNDNGLTFIIDFPENLFLNSPGAGNTDHQTEPQTDENR